MSVEAPLNSPAPVGPRVEDNPEHSFPTSLRRAVDTLFTYQQVIDPLQTAPEIEDSDEFVALWKQGITTHLEETAKAAVTAFLEVLAKVQSGELVARREAGSGIDPYTIAFAASASRIEQLQQSGELRKPSEITDEYEQDDHFDDLARLYKHTCIVMGLAWPPPARDAQDVPEE